MLLEVILIVLILFLVVSLGFVVVKYRKLSFGHKQQTKALQALVKTINSVRYGNLYERVNSETVSVLPNLSNSINSMIESIVDRENMIKEYQTDLSKKIDVLTEIEELKEDFVATITHDLKVPILAEKNMLGFLLDNRFGELSATQKLLRLSEDCCLVQFPDVLFIDPDGQAPLQHPVIDSGLE